jgi:hypothetical protein
MKKYISACLACITFISVFSQDKDKYVYKPFPIYRTASQVVIAGDVSTFMYTNYMGKDVKKINYTDAHATPEYLIYDLFKAMKAGNVDAMKDLYDTTYKKEKFNAGQISTFMKSYTDIQFVSKFRSGDLTVVRYNFIGGGDPYEYFAMVQQVAGKYYLTTNINLSEPFNVIGSLSPSNLTQKTEKAFTTGSMTAFYFIRKDDKIFFTNELPADEYSAVYLSMEKFSDNASSPEKDFMQQLQQAAKTSDAELRNMLSKDDQKIVSTEYYGNYFMGEIKKVFANYSSITPIAAIPTEEGKIVYFKYANPGESAHLSSVILRKENSKYSLSLKVKNDDLNNVLQNNYVKEAVQSYLQKGL